ncbi:hypothetical protein [Winogradskya humida]|uniref:Uncharacterized protein n=1 Tax=Winogradskya humida TaxID=113566 RepID=A0ABQ3ZQ64_9ACTN|nr:hypothetical protein [Actinoplanes humidus]GIE20669.1 hypothetical protein Ahu01nite_037710 [Actinoplanes humidus]
MTSTNDLRAMLERHAGSAPDGHGMIEAAQAGAIRVRRRRKITATVAAAVTVAVVAIGLPVARHLDSSPPPASVTPRAPSDMNVSIAAGSGFTVEHWSAVIGRQELTVVQEHPTEEYPGDYLVQVFDPGWFDAFKLPAGRTIKVAGHDALWLPRLDVNELGPGSTPTPIIPMPSLAPHMGIELIYNFVAWKDRDGRWTTVRANDFNYDRLFRLAAAIRTGPLAPVRGPLQLGWLPEGLTVTSVESSTPADHGLQQLTISVLDRKPEWEASQHPEPAQSGPDPGHGSPITVHITAKSGENWRDHSGLSEPSDTVNGFPAWYSEGNTVPGETHSETESRLFVETTSCAIGLGATDYHHLSKSELLRIAADATIGTCDTNEDGWFPILK